MQKNELQLFITNSSDITVRRKVNAKHFKYTWLR